MGEETKREGAKEKMGGEKEMGGERGRREGEGEYI